MKMNKEMLKKASMPSAKSSSNDDMLSMDGLEFDDMPVSHETDEPADKSGKFADAQDDELLDELKRRGYDVGVEVEHGDQDGEGLPSHPTDEGDEESSPTPPAPITGSKNKAKYA